VVTVTGTQELVVILAVLAASRIVYVVRQVRRDRSRPPRPGTSDAYEGNLVVPAAGPARPGLFRRRPNAHHRGIGYHGDSGGQSGHHQGPGGLDILSPLGGVRRH